MSDKIISSIQQAIGQLLDLFNKGEISPDPLIIGTHHPQQYSLNEMALSENSEQFLKHTNDFLSILSDDSDALLALNEEHDLHEAKELEKQTKLPKQQESDIKDKSNSKKTPNKRSKVEQDKIKKVQDKLNKVASYFLSGPEGATTNIDNMGVSQTIEGIIHKISEQQNKHFPKEKNDIQNNKNSNNKKEQQDEQILDLTQKMSGAIQTVVDNWEKIAAEQKESAKTKDLHTQTKDSNKEKQSDMKKIQKNDTAENPEKSAKENTQAKTHDKDNKNKAPSQQMVHSKSTKEDKKKIQPQQTEATKIPKIDQNQAKIIANNEEAIKYRKKIADKKKQETKELKQFLDVIKKENIKPFEIVQKQPNPFVKKDNKKVRGRA